MALYRVQVSLPDRPGSLGAVASAVSVVASGAFIMDLEPEQSAKQLQEVKY